MQVPGEATPKFTSEFSVICNVSKDSIQSNTFDPDSSTEILNISENTHIFKGDSMFVSKLHEVEISGVAKIVGTYFNPTGTGTLKQSWKYDEGK